MYFQLLVFLYLRLALAQQNETLFVGGYPGQQWAASLVNENACGTTYKLVCTAGTASLTSGYGIVTCDPSGFLSDFATASATYSGTSIYEVYQSYNIPRNGGIEIQERETCSLYGSTRAICTLTASGSSAGREAVVTTVVTSTGATVANQFKQVAITDGTLTSPSSECKTPAPFITPTAPASNSLPPSSLPPSSMSSQTASAGRRVCEVESSRLLGFAIAVAAMLVGMA